LALQDIHALWFSAASFQITQNLIVGPGFFNDEDNVLNLVAHRRHHRHIASVLPSLEIATPTAHGFTPT
jgi:hypothetical protein